VKCFIWRSDIAFALPSEFFPVSSKERFRTLKYISLSKMINKVLNLNCVSALNYSSAEEKSKQEDARREPGVVWWRSGRRIIAGRAEPSDERVSKCATRRPSPH